MLKILEDVMDDWATGLQIEILHLLKENHNQPKSINTIADLLDTPPNHLIVHFFFLEGCNVIQKMDYYGGSFDICNHLWCIDGFERTS